MSNGSPPGERRRLVLSCAALNMEIAFALRPGEFARIGASPEMEITLPLAGLSDEECQLSCDDRGTLWLKLPGGARIKSPDGFEAGPYFFDIVQEATAPCTTLIPTPAPTPACTPVPARPLPALPPRNMFPRPRVKSGGDMAAEPAPAGEETSGGGPWRTSRGKIVGAACAAAVIIIGLALWSVLREGPRSSVGGGESSNHLDKQPAGQADALNRPSGSTSKTNPDKPAAVAAKPNSVESPAIPPRPKAGEEYRAKAEAGDALSQALLADALLYDLPNDAALREAADWAEKSSAQSCALGTQILATMIKAGDGRPWDPDRGAKVENDNVEALLAGADAGPPAWKRWIYQSPMRENYETYDQRRFDYLQRAADAGDVMAAVLLARRIYPGQQDKAKENAAIATRLRSRAEAGAPQAMREMGRLCVDGLGVTMETAAGIAWYEKAAAAGLNDSWVDLAVLYSGVPDLTAIGMQVSRDPAIKDAAKSTAMLERSLAGADSALASAVFMRMELGDALPQNPDAAAKWLAKVAPDYQARAITQLIAQLLKEKDFLDRQNAFYNPVRAEEWYQRLVILPEKPPGVFATLAKACHLVGDGVLQKGDAETLRIRWRRRAAAGGNLEAMHELGNGYASGYLLPKDKSQARKWFFKAAETGDGTSAWYLARFLKDEGDLRGAERWYRKGAEAGFFYAMKELADLLAVGGEGVPKNDTEATAWYRKCAQTGSLSSAAILCRRLENNVAAAAKPGEAAEWREKLDAALAGMSKQSRLWALKDIAKACQKAPHAGPAEARVWWRKAAVEGDHEAIKALSSIPESGTPEEIAEAVKNMEMLAEKGDQITMSLLAYRYKTGKDGVKIDKKRAFHWTAKLAEKGDYFAYSAFSSMGWFYLNGEGVPKNDAEAFKWFRKAVEAGDYDYASMLGNFCQDGKGVPKNETEAARWFERGALMDETDAMINAGAAWGNGTGVRKDHVRAYAWANVAAARGADDADKSIVKKAEGNRRISERQMTRAQIGEAQKLSKELVAQIEANYADLLDRIKNNKPHPPPESLDPPALATAPRARPVAPPDKSAAPGGAALTTGTAWAVSESGHLLTCAHVVSGAVSVKVHLPSGRTVNAAVLRTDKTNDIAILKIETATTPLPLATGPAEVGQKVATLGFPNTTLQGREVKLTDGIVSSLSGIRGARGTMQISAPIQPGNSGGPLLDLYGAVIGIVTARLSDKAAIMESGAVPQAVNYATKVSLARPLLTEFALKTTPPDSATELTLTELAKSASPSVFLLEVTLK
jgi:TPR repeat protein